jgi:hypothetical protein
MQKLSKFSLILRAKFYMTNMEKKEFFRKIHKHTIFMENAMGKFSRSKLQLTKKRLTQLRQLIESLKPAIQSEFWSLSSQGRPGSFDLRPGLT